LRGIKGILALSGPRARYPDDPPEKIRRRLAELYLGPDLAVKVCGPFEEVEDADSSRCDAPVTIPAKNIWVIPLEALDVPFRFW
jgi:hypothetical protein